MLPALPASLAPIVAAISRRGYANISLSTGLMSRQDA
jgi:hypothetical protein